MSEEKPPDPAGLTKRLSGGLNQRLVKAWKLPRKVGPKNDFRGVGPSAVSIYLDSRSGLFYARVPEQSEGTLYAEETLKELDVVLRDAVEEWTAEQRDRELGGRTWERRIRVWYGGDSRQKIGEWGTAKPDFYSVLRYRRVTSKTVANVQPCVEIGALTFTRYERSQQPERKVYDLREFEEDYQQRIHRWEAMSFKIRRERHDEQRPKRFRRNEYSNVSLNGNTHGSRHVTRDFRDLPYTNETWEMLALFTRRFSQLDHRLRDFLLSMAEDQFLGQLAKDTGILQLEDHSES